MPTYLHQCTNCQHQWEDEYSIKADPPTHCPECQQATASRLIYGGSGKGIVELYGQELVDKCKSDAKKEASEASKNEYKYANLLGESRYQNLQSSMDQRRRR